MAGGLPFATVTAPMEIPPEVYRSPNAPELPSLPEMTEMVDAKTTGLRLQGTLAKALPPMKSAGSMTNVRQMEAEAYARDIGASFSISKAQQRRSQAVARAKNRQAQRIAEKISTGNGRSGVKTTQRNDRKSKYSGQRGAQNLSGPSAFPYLTHIR